MSFLDKLREPVPSSYTYTESVDDDMSLFGGRNDIYNMSAGYEFDDDDEPEETEFVDDLEKPSSLELTPEEEAEADSIINIAATPVMLKEVLTQEAVNAFSESEEFDIAVEEGFALEGMRETFSYTTKDLFMEAKFYSKNVMHLTKDAKTNQLFEICVQAIARAKNDPVYFKLSKVQELRRKLKATLRQRYKAPAMKKAKEYIIRMKRSKAPTISNVAKKLG